MKKQIVFVEHFFHIPSFKIAKKLRFSGKYETVLISMKKIDSQTEKFLKEAYDKIIIFELADMRKLTFSNYWRILKLLFGEKGKIFREELKKLNPYIIQITSPDIHTFFFKYVFRKYPRVYFAHDIFKPYYNKLSLKKNSGRSLILNKIFEKSLFKSVDGVLYKAPENILEKLQIKNKGSSMQYLSGCLDEWIINKREKYSDVDNELHLVYAGRPWIEWEGHKSFLEMIEKITKQKIHFDIYTPPFRDDDKKIFDELTSKNKYFHFHNELKGKELNKELSRFDYGIALDFTDNKIVSDEFMDIALATKVFAYIESGIPTLVSNNLKFTLEVAGETGIGIKYEELDTIKSFLKKKNISKQNIIKQQNFYNINKVIPKIISFYDKVNNEFYKNKINLPISNSDFYSKYLTYLTD
jgi:hypothetical protein